MIKMAWRWALAAAGLAAPMMASAADVAGEAHRTIPLASAAARRGDGRAVLDVTIWYPAAAGAVAKPLTVGPPGKPLFDIGAFASDAVPEPGRHPVILLSHGFGGSAGDTGWLGGPLARAGYVVISVDHPGNNAMDKSNVGATSWWERPRDMIAALRAMAADAVFGRAMDPSRVGAAGFSLGGATALALAGGVIDVDHFDRYCQASPDDGACQPPPEMPGTHVEMRQAVTMLGLTSAAAHASEGTNLPGLRAALSIAPNAQALTDASLKAVRVPVVLVAGDADPVVPQARHAAYAAANIPGAKLILVPGARHYSFLATCTDFGRERIDVCRSAPDQATAHQVAIDQAIRLFTRTMPVGRRPAQ